MIQPLFLLSLILSTLEKNDFLMRILILIIVFILTIQLDLNAQQSDSKIIGEMRNGKLSGFAYLIDLKNKNHNVVKIDSGKFSFKIEKKEDFELCYLFIAFDSLKNYDFIMEKDRKSVV